MDGVPEPNAYWTRSFQEDPSRIDMFAEYAVSERSENQWAVFLNLLTRPDAFTTHMTARILAKVLL